MELSTDNAYAELGLARGATEAEVKAAWRRLVSRWHPDRNTSSTAVGRMQRINLAFEKLRGSGFAGGADFRPPYAAPPEPAPAEPAAAPAAAPPPRTLSRKLKLTLEEAALGCIKTLRGTLADRCTACAGSGQWVPGGACVACEGAGSVRQRSWFTWFDTSAACAACAGDGIERQPCGACGATGKLAPQSYHVAVRIPQGVRDADVLQVDAGASASTGTSGGLAAIQIDLRIELLRHPLFQLDPDGTLRCEMPVDGFAWMAQRVVEVPTLAGLQPVTLARDRVTHRLVGQGFPVRRRGPRGDLVLSFVPTFPERFSTDQNILIDQLQATSLRADGQAADPRIDAWNQALRAWQQDPARRGGNGQPA